MKTVILINSMLPHWFDYYSWQMLLKGGDIRLVGIYGREEPFKTREYFDALHVVPIASSEDLFLFEVEWVLTDEIVKKEIERNPNRNQIVVIGNAESDVLLAAKIREKYQLSGPKTEETLLFRNKYLMTQRVSQHGVKTPKFIDIQTQDLQSNSSKQFQIVSETVGLPFVIKPIASASSSGVHVIRHPKELADVSSQYQADPIVLCEEYIIGKGYSCNSVVYDKKIYFSECEEYLQPQLEIKSGKCIGAIPCIHSEIAKKIIKANDRVLKALGLIDGISHSEYLVDREENIYFIEIAARAPGGKSIPFLGDAFGINLLDLEFLLATGQQYQLKSDRNYSFWALVPKIKGKISHLNQPKFASPYNLFWKVKEGDVINNSESLKDHAALLTATNRNYETLYKDFMSLNESKLIEVIKS